MHGGVVEVCDLGGDAASGAPGDVDDGTQAGGEAVGGIAVCGQHAQCLKGAGTAPGGHLVVAEAGEVEVHAHAIGGADAAGGGGPQSGLYLILAAIWVPYVVGHAVAAAVAEVSALGA